MYYQRTIENQIKKNLANNKVLILTGMRRVGKTTLLKEIFKNLSSNKIWFDFENPLNVKYFEDIDYDGVYQNILNKGLDKNKKIYVFIDEAQNYPEISKVIKYLNDHYNIKFVLTGSASFYLKNLFPESLAGRKIIYELFPLNFEEFLRFKGRDTARYRKLKAKKNIKEIEYKLYEKHYDEFIKWGGFPQVALENNIEGKKQMLNDIFSSYFQKEIISLADYKKNNKIRDLILLLAARVGSRLDLTKLSQELQITRTTVYSYLSFLQATYFIYLISPFSKSIDRKVSGSQKVYFCDNGILKIMADVNFGQLLENAAYNQIKFGNEINYYQKPTGAEIDFIVNKKMGYEVKTTGSLVDVGRLERRMKIAKLKKGYVVSKKFVKGIDKIVFAQFL